MFWYSRTFGRSTFAFTDRHGGVSRGPWSSLNLGSSNGDSLESVRSNLDRVASALQLERLVVMSQVHGREAVWTSQIEPEQTPVADALLADEPGVGILVRVADCTPIVLADAEKPLAGVVHAGREGLVKGVVTAAVKALQRRGAARLSAWVGPRACGACYELPATLADPIAEQLPITRSTTSRGTPAIDIGAGVVNQLEELNVAVTDLGADQCTIEDDRWFSYRRQGIRSGRFGAVVVTQ